MKQQPAVYLSYCGGSMMPVEGSDNGAVAAYSPVAAKLVEIDARSVHSDNDAGIVND